jgi:hydrophobic/amphiphilic exporter-1 (mainly G- bacteria), HAE1 family
MWFTQLSIKNPVLATMMMLVFIVLGTVSYQRLKVDQFPEIAFPVVVVLTEYPGASPESVEADVSKKLEEAINTISNINKLSSYSYEGQSVVIVEFDLSVDISKAAQDVREKVALLKPALRKEVKDSRVLRFDPADRPVISLSLSSTPNTPARSTRELTTLADQLVKKRLENVRGVGAVNLVGGVKRQVRVLLNPEKMNALGVGVESVLNALRAENQNLPAGSLKANDRELSIQVQGRFTLASELGNTVVAKRGNVVIYLHQLGTVEDTQEEIDSIALLNGKPTLALNILKSQGQNTIEVVDAVIKAAKQVGAELPSDVKLEVINDGAKAIRTGVDNVKRTLIEGALLTVLIVFLFLNSWRSTVITGLTLPVSLIGTFLFMYVFGFTINMITLMALSLCVGLLIDDAIVVRENIVRHSLMGKDAKTAALDGTQEIGLAVLATTLSIVAVFAPIGFMGGIIGRFFYQFGVTIAAAVLISMFVSFTLDPMLSSVWPEPEATSAVIPTWRRPIAKVLYEFDRLTQWISVCYQSALAWALSHRKSTLAWAFVAFAASFPIAQFLGSEFVPQADFSESGLSFQTPIGSSLALTQSKAEQVDALLRNPKEFPEILYTYTTINTGNSGKNTVSMYLRLLDRKDRSRSQKQLTQPLRERLSQVAGITLTSVGNVDSVSGEKALVYSIQGSSQPVLQTLADEAVKRIHKIKGLVDLNTSSKPSKPLLSVAIKRAAAADAGITTSQTANALRALVGGESAGNWQAADGENYDIDVRLALEHRNTKDDLARLSLVAGVYPDGSQHMVKLTQVADLVETTGASQINRKDMTREIRVDANVFGRTTGEVASDIKQALDSMSWPAGYSYSVGGSTKNMNESLGFALTALVLAVIFIYMVLASQFASFIQPIAIMSSLPLTLIGVVLALLLFGSSLSMFSIIGVVLLMGLVTKNAILLIDFTNLMRKQGMPRREALLEAAKVRLRPILMTTLAMVFGMVPLAFGLAEGSEQRAPMGQAVIGGTITSSILTLVVVPVVYSYLDDLTVWLRARVNRKTH